MRSWEIRHARCSNRRPRNSKRITSDWCTRISLTFTRICCAVSYDSLHTRMHATYIQAYLYVTRYARLYGGSHVTHAHTAHRKWPSIDRRTSAGFYYIRERNASPRNDSPDLLSAFNDRESTANRQNGSINPRMIPSMLTGHAWPERFFSARWNDINTNGQRLLLVLVAFFLFSDTGNDSCSYRAYYELRDRDRL